jgi:hypothetical protein
VVAKCSFATIPKSQLRGGAPNHSAVNIELVLGSQARCLLRGLIALQCAVRPRVYFFRDHAMKAECLPSNHLVDRSLSHLGFISSKFRHDQQASCPYWSRVGAIEYIFVAPQSCFVLRTLANSTKFIVPFRQIDCRGISDT